jgi:hypothetical protein
MAQDRSATDAAAVWESGGIDVPPASSGSNFVHEEQSRFAPWLVLAFRLGDDRVGLGPTDPTDSWRSLRDNTLGVSSLWCESDHDGDPGGASAARVVGGNYMGFHRPRNSIGTGDEPFTFGFGTTDTGAGSLDCGLQPSYVLAVGLDGHDRQAGNVAVHAEAHLGIYAELGIEPSVSLARIGGADVTLAVPLTMGFCLKNYYVDATAGAICSGISTSARSPRRRCRSCRRGLDRGTSTSACTGSCSATATNNARPVRAAR